MNRYTKTCMDAWIGAEMQSLAYEWRGRQVNCWSDVWATLEDPQTRELTEGHGKDDMRCLFLIIHKARQKGSEFKMCMQFFNTQQSAS